MVRFKLKLAIIEQFKTQSAFAEHIGINQKRLSQIVRGLSISQDVADKIAKALGKTTVFLFGREYKP